MESKIFYQFYFTNVIINNIWNFFFQVVPLWRQRAGRDEEKLVIWDYHVILIYKPDERCLVFDLDSDLPFPTYFHKYVTETFRTDAILNPEYHRFFRVVPAPLFLQNFASDRRHMKKPDGSWMKPPPPYPCIMPPRKFQISSHDFCKYDFRDAKRKQPRKAQRYRVSH